MRQVRLRSSWQIPEVKVNLGGSKDRSTRANLVFDTGSFMTQVDVDIIETLGYSARDAIGTASVSGAVGGWVEGYIVPVAELSLLGKDFRNVPVLAYDFKSYPGKEGLLGWDVIKQLHLEMDGPKGILKVY